MKLVFRGTALLALLLAPFVSAAQSDGTPAKPSPAPVVMLKLDDLVNQPGTNGTVPPRWQKLVDFLETEKIKGTIGILTESLEGDCPAYCDWLKQHTDRGYIELWNHGYYRKGLPETLKIGGRKAEYLGGTVAEQAAMFEKSLALMKTKTGIELTTFGPHATAIDGITYEALEKFPQIKAVWFYGPPQGMKTSKVVIRRLMELEKPLFVPNPEQLKENFEKKRATLPYIAIQGHPNQWDEARFEDFKKAVFYLREQGCKFVTLSEFLGAEAGRKTEH